MYESRSNNGGYPVPRSAKQEQPNAYAAAFKGEDTLPLRAFFGVLRKRFWIIALVSLVLMGLAFGVSLAQTPEYVSSIKILIAQEQGDNLPTESLGGEVQGLQQITQTMAEAVNSRLIAEGVIGQLGLQLTVEDLQENLEAKQIGATQFIQVDYKDTNPETAQQVANAVGEVFSEQVAELGPSASAVTATVWDRAELPDDAVSPKPARDGLVALAVGVMLGVALAFLLEFLDESWDSPEEVEQVSGVPTFGFIPEYDVQKSKKEGS